MTTTAHPRAGARVGATYSVLKSSVGEETLEQERKRLTLQPRTSFGKPPPPFSVYFEDKHTFHVPRFYGLERFGTPEVDERADGEPAPNLTFTGTLTDVQMAAMDAVHSKHMHAGGVQGTKVILPCGKGKTVFAVALAARHKRRVCVVVHKAVIREQWKEKFEAFSPGVRVGMIQGRVWDVEGCDVVIAMVMTLAKRDLDPSVFDAFGLVIVDEAHHMAAPVMSRAMRCFRSRLILGLTATKDRPDGLTPLLDWSLGPDGFQAERDASESVRVSIALYEGGTREIITRAGRPLVAVMLNNLAVNHRRNLFIAQRIVALRSVGRVIMVLSDRIAQLFALRDLVLRVGGYDAQEVGVFKGGQSDEERRVQLARPIVMCSYGMANEGVDKTEADTCIMATPKG
ncbi:MAG: DEAD/DEAH box helicase family protein, partial [Actinomycetota bacterium]|nr:DEAD/DEAH box helicase family protein [Actinomycetota bacterium]